MDEKRLVDFLFETGVLKNVKRSGWWLAGIKNPESVADHSFRTAIIAYFLAKLEGADQYKTTLLGLFNDIHETRLNDLHKLAQRYINLKEAEDKVVNEQANQLGTLGDDMKGFLKEFKEQKTKESIIARDADLLENAFQAKEYIDTGYKDSENWIENIQKILVLESSKKLLDIIKKSNSQDWYKSLKKIER